MSTLRSEDRVSFCTFTFADGRRCRTPSHSGDPHLCYFHARKEAQALAAEQAGRDISACLSSGRYLSACNLSLALARLFSAVAQGHIKPKTANILAYLGQTLLQTIRLAQHEYINAFDTDAWRSAVRLSLPRSARGLPQPPQATSQSSRSAPKPSPAAPQPPKGATPATPPPRPTNPEPQTGIEPPSPVRGRVLRSCLQTRQQNTTITTCKINTCKSVSKQRTLTICRINTYEKQGRRGYRAYAIFNFRCRGAALLHPKRPGANRQAPTSPVAGTEPTGKREGTT